jgi:hypothetical protein
MQFLIRKAAIFRKFKAVKGLRGGVQMVRRTRNPADQRRNCEKRQFPDKN